MKRTFLLDPGAFRSFSDRLGVTKPAPYMAQLNMASPSQDIGNPHPSGPVYAPQWEYKGDQSLSIPKAEMSFFLEFHFP